MRLNFSGRAAITISLVVVATATAASVRPPAGPESKNSLRKARIVAAFQHSWDGYVKYAWGHDDLRPISKGYADSRNGWGSTVIDSLGTAIMMGLGDVVKVQLEHIRGVDFTRTARDDDVVSLFESTIRYMGGLLSAYDLLKGPYARTIPFTNKSEWLETLETLISQARTLADTLSYAFNTTTGIPHNNLYINTKTTSDHTYNGLAVTGTLILEWTRLTDILRETTDDPTDSSHKRYAELTLRAQEHLTSPKPFETEVWPGLIGTRIDIATGKFLDAHGGWGGSDDSFYEYLLKTALYSPSRFKLYEDRWRKAADSTIDHLVTHPAGHPEITMVGEYDEREVNGNMGHLTCFIGGNFLLGGHHFNNARLTEYGEKFTEACHFAYNSTATGIGPESWTTDIPSFVSPRSAPFFEKSGFLIKSAEYVLRPEVIESYYHGLVFTGNEKYREWAWEAFENIEKWCRVESGGYMGLVDVNDVSEGRVGLDHMESFWMAETLRYLYLIFEYGEGERVSVKDEGWIFTTEAHPFRVVG